MYNLTLFIQPESLITVMTFVNQLVCAVVQLHNKKGFKSNSIGEFETPYIAKIKGEFGIHDFSIIFNRKIEWVSQAYCKKAG